MDTLNLIKEYHSSTMVLSLGAPSEIINANIEMLKTLYNIIEKDADKEAKECMKQSLEDLQQCFISSQLCQ